MLNLVKYSDRLYKYVILLLSLLVITSASDVYGQLEGDDTFSEQQMLIASKIAQPGIMCGNSWRKGATGYHASKLRNNWKNLSHISPEDTRLSDKIVINNITFEWKYVDNMYAKLYRDGFVVRLNVIVDRTLAKQMDYNRLVIDNLIWSFLFETQLYFERFEMRKAAKIRLVVTNILISDRIFEEPIDVDDMKIQYNSTEEVINNRFIADIHLVLAFRELWIPLTKANPNNIGKPFGKQIIFGVADQDAFCWSFEKNFTPPMVLVTIRSFGQTMTTAHEMAHTFGVYHDGDIRIGPKLLCPKYGFIMSANALEMDALWSHCSIESLRQRVLLATHPCVFDPARVANINPIKPSLDWREFNINDTFNRPDLLPAARFDLNQQCQLMFGAHASPVNAMSENLCQILYCDVGDVKRGHFARAKMGPPLSGSTCYLANTMQKGYCLGQTCLPLPS